MSLSKQVTIWCDRCGEWVLETSTAATLRKELRVKGWTTRSGGKDYCPYCSSKRKKKDHDFYCSPKMERKK